MPADIMNGHVSWVLESNARVDTAPGSSPALAVALDLEPPMPGQD